MVSVTGPRRVGKTTAQKNLKVSQKLEGVRSPPMTLSQVET